MDGKTIVKLLKKEGWELVSIRGSHHKMQKGSLFVIVPVHGKKDLKTGTLRAIEKDSGVKF